MFVLKYLLNYALFSLEFFRNLCQFFHFSYLFLCPIGPTRPLCYLPNWKPHRNHIEPCVFVSSYLNNSGTFVWLIYRCCHENSGKFVTLVNRRCNENPGVFCGLFFEAVRKIPVYMCSLFIDAVTKILVSFCSLIIDAVTKIPELLCGLFVDAVKIKIINQCNVVLLM